MQDGFPTRSKLYSFYCSIKTVYYSGTTTSPKYAHKLLCPCATEHIALYVKMNKHQLGISQLRGGFFYRLYFITVCHLHRGMLIASCDYLHIWKVHPSAMFHQALMNQSHLPRWTTAVYSQGDRQHPKPGDTLHPAVWHMWSSHKQRHKHRNISHLSLSHVTL